MSPAPLPDDEESRLAALHRCTVLDVEDEECFDNLTGVAAAICHAPISLVTLVDRDRVWLKGTRGLDVPVVPRTSAFCGYTILQDLLVVPDARADPRFRDNPFVTIDPGVVFYAGVPVSDRGGHRIGTLCVVDHTPRTGLTPEQVDALKDLGRLASYLLQLRETASRFSALTQSNTDCAYRFRLLPSVELDYVSSAVGALTGYRPEQLYADPALLRSLVHPEDRVQLTQPGCGDLASKVLDLRLLHRDGRVVWTEHRFRTVRNAAGDAVAVYGVARDTTSRHEHEAALRRARGVAERANAAKDDLLSRVSHELRTPLNAVLGFSQLLEMDVEGEQAAAVEQISKAGRHLLRIVDEVLSLSAPDRSRSEVPLVDVRLDEVAHEAVTLIGTQARECDVLVTVAGAGDSVVARADRQQLTDAVTHLVANAVKYNVEGGRVLVECRADGDRAVLSVSDTGAGLDEAALERLFTPFERLDAEARGIAGTGLGLVLAKKAVESMDGSLTIASRPGVGSVFTIELQRSPDHDCSTGPEALPAAVEPAEVPSAFRVVYVEDNESNRTLVQRVLDRRGGVALSLAVDGPTGVALIRETLPDLVLLDLHLPGLDGTQVLEMLRADPATAGLPVVVLTADAMPDTVARLQAQGVAALLTKPLDIRELLVQVDEHARQAVRA